MGSDKDPSVQFCQRAVREGWLGRVFEVDCVMNITHSVGYRKYLVQQCLLEACGYPR